MFKSRLERKKHGWFRPLAAVATVALALATAFGSAGVAAAEGATAGDLQLDAPTHKKTISEQNEDGSYTLSLSVTGDAASKDERTPIDVVIVIDVSDSMNSHDLVGWDEKPYFKKRLNIAKDAATGLVEKLLTSENAAVDDKENIQVSVVSFNRKAKRNIDYTSDADDVTRSIELLGASEGTNWEAGLDLANKTNSNRSDAQKYIVFLSDGEPTYYGVDDVHGTGSSDDDGKCYKAAVSEINSWDGNTTLFSVAASKNATKKMKKLATDANKVNASYLDGTNAENLSKAFDSIVQIIQKNITYTKVSISDELSKWVTGTGANGDVSGFTYTKTDGDDKNPQKWDKAPRANYADGKVTWNLGDMKLEKGVTYTVSFNVKPNKNAYDKAVKEGNNNYLALPTNDEAFVTYSTVISQGGQNDQISDTSEAKYTEEPKINVPYSTVTISKVWSDNKESHPSVKVDLKQNSAAEAYKTIELSNGNWSKTVKVPAGPEAYTWSATEHDVDGYTSQVNKELAFEAGKANSGTITVTNTPKAAEPVKVKVQATKTVDGRDSNQDFTFNIAPADGTDTQGLIEKDGKVSATVSGENGQIKSGEKSAPVNFSGNHAFGFTKEGKYTFDVSEGSLGAGWIADESNPKTVTFNVTKNAENKLVATVNGEEVSEAKPLVLNFKNHYVVTGNQTVELKGVKKLEGREFKNGDSFTFNVSGKDDKGQSAPMPSNAKDGKLTIQPNSGDKFALDFGRVTFESENVGHTYTYEITEAESSVAGVSNNVNGDSYTVTMKVGSDENAELTLEVGAEGKTTNPSVSGNTVSGLSFTNKYEPKKVSLTLAGKKVLASSVEGVTRQIVDDEFSFNLSEVNQDGTVVKALQTVSNKGYEFAFESIEYTEPGVHYYLVTEAPGKDTTISYDATKLLVTVTVNSDEKTGELTIDRAVMNLDTKQPADLVFTNTFTPQTGILSGKESLKTEKVLEGWRDGDKFTFTLTADAEGTPMPEGSKGGAATVVATKDDPKPTFKSITYSQPGKWDYTIIETEVPGDNNSGDLIYSAARYKVHVEASYDSKTHAIDVTSTMTQEKDDQGEELKGDAAAKSVYEARFTNSYKTVTPEPEPTDSVKANISGTKVLENGTLKGGEFQFMLEAADKATESAIAAGMIKMPKDGATNDYQGKFSFDDIELTNESQVDGWKFNVVEVNGGTVDQETGLKYDNAKFEVTIRVDKDADGKLKKPEITVTKDGNAVEGNQIKFVNSYPDAVEVSVGDYLKVSKKLTGDEATLPFKFVLKDANGNAVADTGDVQVTTGKEETFPVNGSLSFAKPGKYEYTLSEVNGGSTLNGVTYDGNSYRVVFEVAYDAASDKLVVSHVTVLNKDNAEVAVPVQFSNSYKKPVVPPTSLTVNLGAGRKHLEGRELKNGEFTFVLKDEKGTQVDRATNSVDQGDSNWGSFQFGSLTFEEPGVYTYTISEVQGNDSDITYDASVYTVTINVKDIATQSYEVTISKDGQTLGGSKDIVFTNTYTEPDTPNPPQPGPDPEPEPEDPTPAVTDITAKKVLDGRELKAGEFTFTLMQAATDGGEAKTWTATNDADGNIVFDDLKFTKAGTYTFQLSEVKGSDGTITYDAAVHTVTVTVKDDGNNKLVATVSYDGGSAPVFTNTYTKPVNPDTPDEPEKPDTPDTPDTPKPEKPTKPSGELPQTGDNGLPAAALAAMAVAGVALVGGGAVLAKRRK